MVLASSALLHAALDVEPAVVACQSLGLHLFAAGGELALVRAPVGFHLLQLICRQLHLGRLCGGRACRRRSGGGLGRSGMETGRRRPQFSKTKPWSKNSTPPPRF